MKEGCVLPPMEASHKHEKGLRPGTENVAYIAGLGQAATLANLGLGENQERLTTLRERLFRGLAQKIDSLTFNGPAQQRLPNTLSVNFPNVIGQELLDRVPELCASTGSACHSGTTSLSATLQAIGLSPDIARGTVRLSLGWQTSEEDVDHAIDLLEQSWQVLADSY